MRRGFLILGFGLIVGIVAYCAVYLAGTAPKRTWMHSSHPELAWLKKEYHLSDAEFSRISQLHANYLSECSRRCLEITQVNERLKQVLERASDVTPAIDELLKERAKMRADCQSAMLRHFFEASRAMPPEQGRRYLRWVEDQTCLRESAMAGPGGEAMPSHVH